MLLGLDVGISLCACMLDDLKPQGCSGLCVGGWSLHHPSGSTIILCHWNGTTPVYVPFIPDNVSIVVSVRESRVWWESLHISCDLSWTGDFLLSLMSCRSVAPYFVVCHRGVHIYPCASNLPMSHILLEPWQLSGMGVSFPFCHVAAAWPWQVFLEHRLTTMFRHGCHPSQWDGQVAVLHAFLILILCSQVCKGCLFWFCRPFRIWDVVGVENFLIPFTLTCISFLIGVVHVQYTGRLAHFFSGVSLWFVYLFISVDEWTFLSREPPWPTHLEWGLIAMRRIPLLRGAVLTYASIPGNHFIDMIFLVAEDLRVVLSDSLPHLPKIGCS